jgi:predicted nucleic acid-binding protein
MVLLLDSNAFSDLMRKHPRVEARLKALEPDDRKGLTLDENDLWLPATASSLEVTLVTRDGDFGGIEGLKITDWTQ